MAITKKEVEQVARLARIGLTEKEKENFTEQLAHILDYIDQLKKVDTGSVKPMAQPIPLKNVFRKDEVHPSCLEEKIINQAPEREGMFFKVEKVIE